MGAPEFYHREWFFRSHPARSSLAPMPIFLPRPLSPHLPSFSLAHCFPYPGRFTIYMQERNWVGAFPFENAIPFVTTWGTVKRIRRRLRRRSRNHQRQIKVYCKSCRSLRVVDYDFLSENTVLCRERFSTINNIRVGFSYADFVWHLCFFI